MTPDERRAAEQAVVSLAGCALVARGPRTRTGPGAPDDAVDDALHDAWSLADAAARRLREALDALDQETARG